MNKLDYNLKLINFSFFLNEIKKSLEYQDINFCSKVGIIKTFELICDTSLEIIRHNCELRRYEAFYPIQIIRNAYSLYIIRDINNWMRAISTYQIVSQSRQINEKFCDDQINEINDIVNIFSELDIFINNKNQ